MDVIIQDTKELFASEGIMSDRSINSCVSHETAAAKRELCQKSIAKITSRINLWAASFSGVRQSIQRAYLHSFLFKSKLKGIATDTAQEDSGGIRYMLEHTLYVFVSCGQNFRGTFFSEYSPHLSMWSLCELSSVSGREINGMPQTATGDNSRWH